jgi:ATP-dependent protease ClpP protease subunit
VRSIFGTKMPHRFRAVSNAGKGEIDIYGVVGGDWFGGGITQQMVADALRGMGSVSSIDININSPGGDVFEGRGIYNLLKASKATKNIYVVAEASSAASLIAMAGDKITMLEGSLMMIHRASGLAMGNVDDILRFAELLKTIDQTLVETYVSRTGNTEGDVRAWLDAETWMTAAEAKDRGFADVAETGQKAAAMAQTPMALDRARLGFKNMPAALRPNRARALKLIGRR